MHPPIPRKLSWRAESPSHAGLYLHLLMAGNPTHTTNPPQPFLKVEGLETRPQGPRRTVLPVGAFDLLVFPDQSALLTTRDARPKVLPRVLNGVRSRDALRAVPDSLAESVHALWYDHAHGPDLARPMNTPCTASPPEGCFWSPFDVFPTKEAVFDLEKPSPFPNVHDDDIRAICGMFLELFGEEGQRRRASFLASPWGSARFAAVSFQNRRVVLPASVRTTLCELVPNLTRTVGAGFWHGLDSLGTNRARSCVAIEPVHLTAHLRMELRHAWRGRMDAEQHRRWEHLLNRLNPTTPS